MLRLALMLYLTPIRRSFGIYPVTMDIHVAKLWALFQDKLQVLPTAVLSNELRFWVAMVGAIEAQGILRDAFAIELRDLARTMEIVSLSEAEECFHSVMLMEVHGPGLRSLWMDTEMEL